MAAVVARHGSIVLGADAIYVSLSGSKAFASHGASGDVTLDQRETILQPMIGYNIEGEIWSVDALAGARYWNLSSALGVDPARRDSRSRSGTKDWLDATAGLRARVALADFLVVSVEGDGGAGGSRNSWQAAGAVSLELSQRYSVMGGYRYLAVDYEREGFLFDTQMNGWVLGVNLRY